MNTSYFKDKALPSRALTSTYQSKREHSRIPTLEPWTAQEYILKAITLHWNVIVTAFLAVDTDYNG